MKNNNEARKELAVTITSISILMFQASIHIQRIFLKIKLFMIIANMLLYLS